VTHEVWAPSQVFEHRFANVLLFGASGIAWGTTYGGPRMPVGVGPMNSVGFSLTMRMWHFGCDLAI